MAYVESAFTYNLGSSVYHQNMFTKLPLRDWNDILKEIVEKIELNTTVVPELTTLVGFN